jgi:branched-chain amino acid transport system ATP-binding protein
VLGANGAGKTTTLRAISGLVSKSGEIVFDGQRISTYSTERVARLGIAHVPEGRGVVAGLTVAENLRLGAYLRRDRAVKTDIEKVLDVFPRLRERQGQAAGTLSGGEQQMLVLGRALVGRPRLLMLDEPSLGLAPAVVESMYETFGRLHGEGLTILLAEQSIELALEVSDFATVLQVGRSVLSGTAASLSEDPQVQKAYLGTG